VLTEGPQYDAIVAFYRQRGSRAVIKSIVLIEVDQAASLISPAYDDGTSEAAIRRQWEGHYADLQERWATNVDTTSE